ncbi:MAG: DNA ligase (NAD(+)) LigA, partial [Ancrocorticia sp.]|nr:DNA ligase (NAD(+)) LigA [Ancrocorticia sp.]
MNSDALYQAKARWEEIAPLLASAQVAYHSGAAPEITDDHYDRLIHELRDIEAAHPELASQDSPTQNVGADATATGFAPVTHLERLFSLQDVFTLEDLQAW